MSKILVDTIDTRSGTSTMTIGSSNTSTIALKAGATLTNFPNNTPAFEAHLSSNASFNTNTSTKITFDTEIYDTDSTYNVSNGRFTPGVAGKYFVYTTITATAGATNNVTNAAQIYINGIVGPGIISSFNFTGNYLNVHVAMAQGVFDLDTDDYIEIFGRCLTSNGAAGTFTAGNRSTMFGAYRIGT